MKAIWIAWEEHRRTKELCSFLGINSIIMKSKLPRILKYPLLAVRTLCVILREKPATVLAQNPSIILSIFLCLLKAPLRFTLVIDLHNAAIIPELPVQKLLYFIYSYVHKSADLSIVTNQGLKDVVSKHGGRAIVLPDRLPQFDGFATSTVTTTALHPYFVLICTFCNDEPFTEVFEAFRLLPEKTVYVTGDSSRCSPSLMSTLPSNVILTGYLEEEQYINLLIGSSGIIDLTERENCLVCGAYEAVSLGKPLLLSNKEVLKAYFRKGAVFCDNNRYDIKASVLKMHSLEDLLSQQVRELKQTLNHEWGHQVSDLVEYLRRVA